MDFLAKLARDLRHVPHILFSPSVHLLTMNLAVKGKSPLRGRWHQRHQQGVERFLKTVRA